MHGRVTFFLFGSKLEPLFLDEIYFFVFVNVCFAVLDEDVHEMYDFTGPVLGSGAFATVLRVRDRMSGVEYAVKQVSWPVAQSWSAERSSQRRVALRRAPI